MSSFERVKSEKWKVVALVMTGWNLLGFMVGGIETGDNRTAKKWEYIPNKSGGLDTKVIDVSTSGCVYESWGAFTNLGYLAGCELYRRRFQKEGFK